MKGKYNMFVYQDHNGDEIIKTRKNEYIIFRNFMDNVFLLKAASIKFLEKNKINKVKIMNPNLKIKLITPICITPPPAVFSTTPPKPLPKI